MLDEFKRRIIDAMVAVDKQGLDPVRGALGLQQYYGQGGTQAVPANRGGQSLDAYQSGYGNPTPGPDPQIAGGKVSRDYIRSLGRHQAHMQDIQREFTEQRDRLREDFRGRGQPDERKRLLDALMQQPPQGQAQGRFAGVTSDDMAAALPQQAPIPQPAPRFAGVTSDDLAAAQGGRQQVHQIKSGDTLSEIARKYGTTVEALARANQISDPNRIYAGQQLRIA